MNWIIVLTVEAVTIFCIFKFAWFRNFLLVIIGLAGAYFYYIDYQQRLQNQASIIMIFPKEIELHNLVFSDPLTQPGSNEIKGRIKNNFKGYTIDALCLHVQLVDAYKDRSKVIGGDEVYLSLDIPPQQSRDFMANLNFESLNAPSGKWDWLCSVGPVKVADHQYPIRTN